MGSGRHGRCRGAGKGAEREFEREKLDLVCCFISYPGGWTLVPQGLVVLDVETVDPYSFCGPDG